MKSPGVQDLCQEELLSEVRLGASAGCDDGGLVARFLAGDAEALGVIYDHHASALLVFLRNYLGAEDAEDALHDVFAEAARRFASYSHDNRLRAWLATIARNLAFDRLRQRKRRRERPLEDGMLDFPVEASGYCDPEIGRKLRTALEALPESQREVFLLREDAGLSFREIADALGIPINTALSHMRRAVLGLRERLAGLGDCI